MGSSDIEKINNKQEVTNDLSSYSNLKLAKENLKREINALLNTESLEKIQNHIDRLNKAFTPINNAVEMDEKKYSFMR